MHGLRRGEMSCLAGFISPGESVGDAAIREVMEEAGVKTKNPRYLFSQPWPFPAQLMIGIALEAVTTEIRLRISLSGIGYLRRPSPLSNQATVYSRFGYSFAQLWFAREKSDNVIAFGGHIIPPIRVNDVRFCHCRHRGKQQAGPQNRGENGSNHSSNIGSLPPRTKSRLRETGLIHGIGSQMGNIF